MQNKLMVFMAALMAAILIVGCGGATSNPGTADPIGNEEPPISGQPVDRDPDEGKPPQSDEGQANASPGPGPVENDWCALCPLGLEEEITFDLDPREIDYETAILLVYRAGIERNKEVLDQMAHEQYRKDGRGPEAAS